MPDSSAEPLFPTLPVWRRCWCYQYGRCLVDCPTADVPRPKLLTDRTWSEAYEAVLADA